MDDRVHNLLSDLSDEVSNNYELTYSDLEDFESDNPPDYKKLIKCLDSSKITAKELDALAEHISIFFGDDGEKNSPMEKEVKKSLTKYLKDECEIKIQSDAKKSQTKDKKSSTGRTIVKKVMDSVVDDSKTVALRIAAKSLPKLISEPLITMIVEKSGLPTDESFKGKLRAFLQSEMGSALISVLVSGGLEYLPLPEAAKESASALAKEMRLQSYTTVAQPAVDMLLIPASQLLTSSLVDLKLPGFESLKQLTASTDKKESKKIRNRIEIEDEVEVNEIKVKVKS